MIETNYRDVLNAARQLVHDAGHDTGYGKGWWRGHNVPALLAGRMGLLDQRNLASTGLDQVLAERFDKQCTRAFNELAADGVLLKAGRGESSPRTGRILGNTTEFYTPAAHAQAVGDRARQLAGRAEIRGMWEQIHDRLSDAGYPPQSQRGDRIELSPGTWLELLGQLD